MLRIILVDEERTVGHGPNGSKLLKEWGLCRVEGAGMTKNRVLRPNCGLYFSLIPPARVRNEEKQRGRFRSQGGIGPNGSGSIVSTMEPGSPLSQPSDQPDASASPLVKRVSGSTNGVHAGHLILTVEV